MTTKTFLCLVVELIVELLIFSSALPFVSELRGNETTLMILILGLEATNSLYSLVV